MKHIKEENDWLEQETWEEGNCKHIITRTKDGTYIHEKMQHSSVFAPNVVIFKEDRSFTLNYDIIISTHEQLLALQENTNELICFLKKRGLLFADE